MTFYSTTFFSEERYHSLFHKLAEQAATIDRQASWPQHQLQGIADAKITGWGIPESLGGISVSAEQQARFYLDCSAACLTTAFIFSQRNAAVSRLVASSNTELQQQLLPSLATGELFTTVGISHLSTSRQHLGTPAVTVTEVVEGYLLNGSVPWVTGGLYADFLLTGGTLPDGRQILVTLHKDRPGVSQGKPAEMLALNASATGNFELHDVLLPHSQLVAGPENQVMQAKGSGTGSLTTSTLALGVAGRAVNALQQEALSRPVIQTEAEQLLTEWQQLTEELLAAERNPAVQSAELNQRLRTKANSLVLRAAQAYLTAAKGAGFLTGHPAERTIREAMFFLVWSCPQTVAAAALKEFACSPGWL